MRRLFAIVVGLCSAFFLFYTLRLIAVTRAFTQLRPGGGGAWVGAVVFPALALLFAWAAIRLWRGSRPRSAAASDFKTLIVLVVVVGAPAAAMPRVAGAQSGSAIAQQSTRAPRPAPPARDPHTSGFVAATELPDGTVPSSTVEGNFIIGPTHKPAPEMAIDRSVPHGAIYTFTMRSADSRIYPGIRRDSGTFGVPDPTDPAKLIVTTSRPAPYTRRVAVYVPVQYVRGTAAPFIVGADGPDSLLFVALANLIAAKRVPVMIAISIGNGSGDAQGSERGLEYDAMSGRYAEFVETEVLPLVERQYGVILSKNPDQRAAMGLSSGGAAAFSMAWYRNDLYHRVLAYSLTAVNQQWPPSAETPHGAWEYHEHLIPNSPVKPIRIWMMVGDKDLLNPNVMRDDMHDWVLANERMAAALAAKGYHYQFVFARNALHVDRDVRQQTLPEALEWLWRH
jgi:enterochelin esterase-like enzyme